MPVTLLAADMQPRSELVVEENQVLSPKYPVIDFHNHLELHEADTETERWLAEMDAASVEIVVNLSGGWGADLEHSLNALDRTHPGRFLTFCNVDWAEVGTPNWTECAVKQLQDGVRAGAVGLKVFKELGLRYRDPAGKLVFPDDPRIADLWDAAGELGVPVLIHTADPVAFFKPLDGTNERWDELHRMPSWHFYGPQFPSFGELIAALYRAIEAHPRTTFVAAHVGCYPENLALVSDMLDRYPNLYTDFSARLAELGRAPYSARRFLLRHAQRIVFGTDEPPRSLAYRVHYRFLETEDEYFEYAPGAAIPPQGRWRIYGVNLPDPVLRLIYRDNALRLLGRL